MTHRNRRTFVTTVATAGTIGLAGCLSSIRGDDDDESSTQTDQGGDGDNGGTDGPTLPGESIDDFETLEWTSMIDAGRLEADTDDPYAGSQSARLFADEGTDRAAIYRTFPGGTDLSEKTLSLAVSFSDREQLHLTLELFAPGSGNAHRLERTLTGPTDRWVRVDFGITGVDGQPNLENVREIRLAARRRGDSDGEIDCRIDDLRAIDQPDDGSVMLLFDGALESHYETALEHTEEYGFPGVEAVLYEALGDPGRLSVADLGALSNAGWEMAARPRTGAQFMHELSPEEQEGAIRRTQSFLESRGFEDGARHFVTPRNVLGPETIDLVREYHDTAFRFGGGPNGKPLTDPHNVGFFSGGAGETTKRYVDYAAEHGQLAVLHFEEIGGDGLSERAFEDLLEHIDDADVDVVTPSDLLESTGERD
ncbi:polysaccharide deacetylase family protein [Natronolimnohabitans innermongolicus]|uniref:Polysaccharide deacetylase n=1 Tax=Natronolimnohabitans innermongolicus JCM 12255 TaxID=1227499 RepID=L9XIX6_9EURY|nr:hypothetical protein [Natronolimnohabitans innermongolicus]ELY60613.1 hypothetical protein C493_04031 [Natronolimnohabitans innermongolicus JCM 12255]